MIHSPTANGWLEGLIKASLFGAMVAAVAVTAGCSDNPSTGAAGAPDSGEEDPPPTFGAANGCSTDVDCVTTCKNTPNYLEKISNNYTLVDLRCNYEKKCIRSVWAGGVTNRVSDGAGLGQTAFIQYCK
jgi:hypothetical protein